MVRIAVDADNMLGRQFSELERQNLGFAVMQACNATAFEIRQTWARNASRVFDRPTAMTLRAAQYRKATRQKLFAEIYLRDEASNGTPPAKYLRAQVEGGQRRKKGFEMLLQQKGAMPAGMFAVPGKGAPLDMHGNVKSKEIQRILSQLGARSDRYTNESAVSRKRRLRREERHGIRRSDYFVLHEKVGSLPPGIWQRDRAPTGQQSGLWLVFAFVRKANYKPRYNIFALAEREWDRLMPFYFNRELQKALDSSKYRGQS